MSPRVTARIFNGGHAAGECRDADARVDMVVGELGLGGVSGPRKREGNDGARRGDVRPIGRRRRRGAKRGREEGKRERWRERKEDGRILRQSPVKKDELGTDAVPRRLAVARRHARLSLTKRMVLLNAVTGVRARAPWRAQSLSLSLLCAKSCTNLLPRLAPPYPPFAPSFSFH